MPKAGRLALAVFIFALAFGLGVWASRHTCGSSLPTSTSPPGTAGASPWI